MTSVRFEPLTRCLGAPGKRCDALVDTSWSPRCQACTAASRGQEPATTRKKKTGKGKR